MNNKYEIVKGSQFIDAQKIPELTIKYFQIAEYKNNNQKTQNNRDIMARCTI